MPGRSRPGRATLDAAAAVIELGAAAATLRFHVGMPVLIGGCAALGVVWGFLGAGGRASPARDEEDDRCAVRDP